MGVGAALTAFGVLGVLGMLLVVACLLIANYVSGARFRHDASPESTAVHVLPIDIPSSSIIRSLLSAVRLHGSALDPALNFNNARGKKLNATEMRAHCPEAVEWFMGRRSATDDGDGLLARCSAALGGESVTFAGLDEKYRIFARLYEDEFDFLNWHYDNNFTTGTRYTLVVPLLVDACNTSEFRYLDARGGDDRPPKDTPVKVRVGQGMLYNGSRVYHRITPQSAGCKRLVVIIPLYTNPTRTAVGAMRETARNLTYNMLTL
jgi:hypothetical protein